jgi:hypothetical protein
VPCGDDDDTSPFRQHYGCYKPSCATEKSLEYIIAYCYGRNWKPPEFALSVNKPSLQNQNKTCFERGEGLLWRQIYG